MKKISLFLTALLLVQSFTVGSVAKDANPICKVYVECANI